VTYQWVDCDRDFVARRYDRIAGLITLFDWLLFVPAKYRRRAAQMTAVRPGDHVLEIGCGTGRNLGPLREAVGRNGHVYGVDLSKGMLSKARALCERQGWSNVTLVHADALEFEARRPLDGVLFGLSYNTMPNHQEVLRHALSQLRPGGRIVIMDAKLPRGPANSLILPFSLWLMKRTLLGNPLIRPWEHLEAVTERFEMEDYLFGSYYICRGVKPVAARGLVKDRARELESV
jgi:demethylmenaquinone methyltransferase/2-methoxy-6-polyprenyl-1,4-benzoquinol methylase